MDGKGRNYFENIKRTLLISSEKQVEIAINKDYSLPTEYFSDIYRSNLHAAF